MWEDLVVEICGAVPSNQNQSGGCSECRAMEVTKHGAPLVNMNS
jgi:hypothetical protein